MVILLGVFTGLAVSASIFMVLCLDLFGSSRVRHDEGADKLDVDEGPGNLVRRKSVVAAGKQLATFKDWQIDLKDLELLEIIGEGDLGTVQRGKFRGSDVAVKHVVYTGLPLAVINKEISSLIRLRAPTLVLCMGVALPKGSSSEHVRNSSAAEAGTVMTELKTLQMVYIVSEYMSGGSLHRLLRNKDVKMNLSQQRSMAREIAAGMHFLHGSNPPVVHKNITSKNVLVDGDFKPKLSDYGLDAIRNQTQRKGLIMWPHWAAPEVLLHGAYSPASDVYAFGVVLWEILTRDLPFSHLVGFSNKNIHVVKAVLSGDRPKLPAGLHPKYAALLNQCWAKDPAMRLSSGELIDTLDELKDVPQFAGAEAAQRDEEAKISVPPAMRHSRTGSNVDAQQQLAQVPNKEWLTTYNDLAFRELLGHGSFGEVWLCDYKGREVAVKKIRVQSEAHIHAFHREVTIMAAVQHPYLVKFLGACADKEHVCIIMEACPAGTLSSLLKDHTRAIRFGTTLNYMLQCAQAVEFLHSQNPMVLHKDIKASNFLLGAGNVVKLADFGLAQFFEDISSADAADVKKDKANTCLDNLSGDMVGTSFWHPPEVLDKGAFSKASDIYSLGVVLWELITRQVPFAEYNNVHQIVLAVVDQDARPTMFPYIPLVLAKLLAQCFAADPSMRPTAKEVVAVLQELQRTGLPRTVLGPQNGSTLYVKTATVFAFQVTDRVVCRKDWGTVTSSPGDWIIVGPGNDVYTCDDPIFQRTYASVGASGQPHEYRKHARTWALELAEDVLIETLEGLEIGRKGDFLAQNPDDGEQWPIDRKKFLSMYQVAEDQTPPEKSNNDSMARLRARQEEEDKKNADAATDAVSDYAELLADLPQDAVLHGAVVKTKRTPVEDTGARNK